MDPKEHSSKNTTTLQQIPMEQQQKGKDFCVDKMVFGHYTKAMGRLGTEISIGICPRVDSKAGMVTSQSEQLMGGSHPPKVYLALKHH